MPVLGDSLEAELAAVVGEAAAVALCGAFAGRALYVPRAPGPDHPVTRLVGAEAAALLGDYFHSTRLEFPVAPAKRRRILQLAACGWKNGEIAAELLVTDRFVRKVLAEARDADAEWNAGLFGTAAE